MAYCQSREERNICRSEVKRPKALYRYPGSKESIRWWETLYSLLYPSKNTGFPRYGRRFADAMDKRGSRAELRGPNRDILKREVSDAPPTYCRRLRGFETRP
jgi:hypothetical protein